MIINSGFEVAQPVDKVWKFFDDIPQVASCLPGAELTEDLGDGKYKGRVNNYLSAQGYDLKLASKEWAERRKGEK